jgi:RNA polymerase sigma factor (sigma-70 family)
MASRRDDHQRCSERNARLLDRLMRNHGGSLLRRARFHSECAEDAEEAPSEAALHFLRSFDGREEAEAHRWMLLVVKRCAWAISRQRRERRSVVEEVSADAIETELGIVLADERRGPAQLAESDEEIARFAAGLRRLKPDERRAITLLALGYSRAEIRELQGWSQAKLHRSLVKGRARLRALLAEGGDGS